MMQYKESSQLRKNKISEQKMVNINIMSDSFWLFSNPIILMMNLKDGKRAEAGQWTLEIQKMLRGIIESVIGLENIMNQASANKKLCLDGHEIIISEEKRYWLMIYLNDNAILRIYACLEKIAQMCRCFFEGEENGKALGVIRKCGCKEIMTEDNCNFGSLITYLNSGNNKENKNQKVMNALNKLNSNSAISNLRPYRNTFTHRKHAIDNTSGLDPNVRSEYKPDGTIKTQFNFGGDLPSINWFRVEIVNANNAIIEFLNEVQETIFPRDFTPPVFSKQE